MNIDDRDTDKDLSDSQILRILLSESRETRSIVANMASRLAALESRVDDKLKDTRPLWTSRFDKLDEFMVSVEKQLRALNHQLDSRG